MNILFIYTNINGFHTDTYSFGLASIVSITKKNNYNTKVFLIKNQDQYQSVLNEIQSFKPDLVGFTSVSSQFVYVSELAARIKAKFPSIIIVCGGIHPTIFPGCLLEADALDGIFIGEGEYSFVEFLERLNKNEPYFDVDNFGYLESGKVVTNRLKPLINNLDELPFPDKETYPFIDTLKATGYAPFIFSRGCPYNCTYCSNHAIAKTYGKITNTTRYRGVEKSILEIQEVISKFYVRRVGIVDDIFGINKDWRNKFCEEYKRNIKTPFFCLLRVNLVDEEFISLLKDAGCYRLSFGVESGNEYIRNHVMNRNISTEQIVNAFALARKYKLETNSINIIGTPQETEEMIWDTIKLNRRLKPTSSGVNIFYPYKGTKLGDECFKKGLVNQEKYNSFSNERRESILNYPDKYKKKLTRYQKYWEYYVYSYNIKKLIILLLRQIILLLSQVEFLRKIKHFIGSKLSSKQKELFETTSSE